mgnify:CR=1 FL=1
MKLNKAGMMGFFLCFMAIIFGVGNQRWTFYDRAVSALAILYFDGGRRCVRCLRRLIPLKFAYGQKVSWLHFKIRKKMPGS